MAIEDVRVFGLSCVGSGANEAGQQANREHGPHNRFSPDMADSASTRLARGWMALESSTWRRMWQLLPRILRSGVEVIVIHDGDHYAGGNNWGVLIYTKHAEKAVRRGFLEELLIHESADAGLDSMQFDELGWPSARKEDGTGSCCSCQNQENFSGRFLLLT